MYLHAIVNRGFGNVIWTGIWTLHRQRRHLAGDGRRRQRFPHRWTTATRNCGRGTYNPDDGWVYVVSTGFQRDKGIILRRVRPDDVGDRRKYSGWGWADNQWAWDNTPTPITPPAETWGELTLRRLDSGTWILGGFLSSSYALGIPHDRAPRPPTSTMRPLQTPLVGTTWDAQDLANNQVAQLYGGYVLPGSTLDTQPAGSAWSCRSGTPRRGGRTGRCSSR